VKTPPADLIPCAAALLIPALTWFFSYRRHLFMMIFGGYRPLAGSNPIPDQPDFGRGLRTIAVVQLLFAIPIVLFVLRRDLFPWW
jgi:hypothetical protein